LYYYEIVYLLKIKVINSLINYWIILKLQRESVTYRFSLDSIEMYTLTITYKRPARSGISISRINITVNRTLFYNLIITNFCWLSINIIRHKLFESIILNNFGERDVHILIKLLCQFYKIKNKKKINLKCRKFKQ